MSSILSKEQIEHFIYDGFVRIDNAFSKEVANAALDILWQDIPFDRSNPGSWTEPVIRLGMYLQEPFIKSVNTPSLYTIFDELLGSNTWIPCKSVGTFPVRFPTGKLPNDTGKHVDVSFPGDDPENYFTWRANIRSKGRALLMLVLYSDVSSEDAPTVIYKQSHMDIAKLLYPEGDKGLSFLEIAARLNDLPNRDEVFATGKAGTIYLCHPFLVHSAQSHRGVNPKFMAQPPLLLRGELNIIDSESGLSPVERAIRVAID
ncbi:phytanoyl-CoA dioxygenase family protein [Pararcticibacter amylolyticus]|uniref:Phytanoyl-CoA dioxygenase n=1 Tax=Pararcticibacter amylolyticus TaxID=2173175 RepID=A0A2U2PHK7_9SPHI|nr:phytanoyl-CoA dioxygenase [Pararcticibacter amylolyticus]PWG80619.1 phytanoyl-CoA dioxygenase [Pararcticibacter amylolyticus]